MRCKEVILMLLAMGIVQIAFAQKSETPPESLPITTSTPEQQADKLKRQIEKLRTESWQYRTQAIMRERELQALKQQALIAKEQELLAQPAAAPSAPLAAEQALPKSAWKNEVELGGALARGNRSSSQGVLSVASTYETDTTRFQSKAYGEIAREDGSTKAQGARGTTSYHQDINHLYYWLLAASMEHDRISKVDYRGTVGPGLGQHFIKTQNLELMGEVGPAYFVDRRETEGTNHTVRGRAAQEFWWRIIKPVRFFEKAELFNDFDRSANLLLHVEAGFESDITDHLMLRMTVRERYEGEPAPDVKKNDISFITSLVWGF